MKFIAQFDVISDVSASDNAVKHSIQSPEGDFSLVIRETVLKEGERLARLRCNMEFESEALEHAQQDFMDRVLGVLDRLSLVTHAIFRFDRLHKIFDWTPNKTMRSGLIFVYDPPESTPEWVLDENIFETANLFQHASIDDQMSSALRWFRLGIIADTPQEQFQNFWFALELLAQHKKTTNRVHDICARCGEALYCETCNTHPKHRPYPKQAIESVFQSLEPSEPELFPIMNKVRNSLLHGERVSKTEVTTGVPLDQIVDPLARLTWKGLISEVVASLPEDMRPDSLKVSAASTFVRWTLAATAHIEMDVPLGPDGTPDIELLTGITVEFGAG